MLKGKNINLRLIQEKDLEEFYKLDTDLSNRGDYYPLMLTTEPGLKDWFNKTGLWDDSFGRMLIVDKTDKISGYINYFKTYSFSEHLEIGYIIFDENVRGKGISTEALQLFVDYLFKSKKPHRFEIRIHQDNIPSQKVAEKCGFIFEGKMRSAGFRKNKYYDLLQYSLLRDEYYNNKKQ